MKYFYKILIYLIILILGISFFSVLCFGTSEVVFFLLNGFGYGDKFEFVLPIIDSIPLWGSSVFLIFCILLFSLLLRYQRAVMGLLKKGFGYWKQAFVNLFRDLSSWQVLLIMLIPFGASVYFAATIPVSYDEAVTYNLFTSKPFFYSLIFYPYPNNHVLHSLLTNITDYTPFASALFSMRIPAILSSLLAWLIAYSFVKKYYGAKTSILVVGLASVLYMSIYYSFMSRGYAFVVLCFIVCMYAAFNIIKNGSRNKDWMFFTVAGILGCYAIPSFLYPFATLNLLILIYNIKNIKQQIISNVIAGVVVVLLYAPIMFFDGVKTLIANPFVLPISRMYLLEIMPDFYIGMFTKIIGVPAIVLFLMPIPFILTVLQRNKWHISLWIIFALAPFVLMMLQAVEPFHRTFVYYNFILMFLMITPFKAYLDKIPKNLLVVLLMLVQSISIYSFDAQIAKNEGFNTDVSNVVNQYFKEENTICFPCFATENYKFEAKVRGLEDKIEFREKASVNVDTIVGFDYVIVPKDFDKTIIRKPDAASERQYIYKLKR